MLDKQDFLTVVKNTPLVAIDLIVRSSRDEILMGLRVNEPAAGYWFVPGGRIYKSETLEAAFRRITATELGTAFEIDSAQLLGAFTHLYETNFAKEPDISTHYVVLGYQLQLDIDINQLPAQQHATYRWIGKNEDLSEVHPNSQAYYPYLR
ncbi:GDP-mannose mannosyl hydrolase [Methylomonas sp. EFPC1]|uniref:GDP-mannose mannosyl hydrolase n=1 Tax=unclassified Methylomonas TaxID=2608980 RepID=UPI00051BCF9F|nr:MULTISPECIES: GDP-mannose mannosyl hydrolase [unclassified Methylomonas]PKD42098.1 GDP-mannose mannosyl hydrolase [Methylomonas sp. Kb3]QBC26873.1 GDP-mannose mannosyl hydrolase [Methylomonas sp. LW13]QSB02752.1 GDP-mannose mannosyl hydrolase [Methylomonas sp. EFPC1]